MCACIEPCNKYSTIKILILFIYTDKIIKIVNNDNANLLMEKFELIKLLSIILINISWKTFLIFLTEELI